MSRDPAPNPEKAVAVALERLRAAGRAGAPTLNAYLAALNADHGWSRQALAELLGASRQAVVQRIQRAALAGEVPDIDDLPYPSPPTRVRRPRPSVSGMEAPDREAIEVAAAEQTLRRIRQAGDAEAQLRAAATIVNSAERRIAELDTRRRALAWSLSVHDGVPPGELIEVGHWDPHEFFAAYQKALGMTWRGLNDLPPEEKKRLVRARRIWRQATARAEYPEVSAERVAARAQLAAAVPLRDELIVAALPRDTEGARPHGAVQVVADVVGLSRGRVSQIVNGAEAPAAEEGAIARVV